MNTKILSLVLTTSLLAFVAGCEKQDAPTPSTSQSTPSAAAPQDAAAQTQKADEAVKDTAAQAQAQADKAAAQAKQQAESLTKVTETKLNEAAATAAAANEKIQAIIDSAKKLVVDKKYDEALKVLSGLSAYKLSADQQSIVDSLKEQITKGLAGKATSSAEKAVGGLLGK